MYNPDDSAHKCRGGGTGASGASWDAPIIGDPHTPRGAISGVARVASATLDFARGPSFTGVTCNLYDLVIDNVYFLEKCV